MLHHKAFSLCLLFVTWLLQSCSFSGKAGKKLLHKAEENAPYDIIIVPGIQFENGQWDRTMKGRIYWSKYLFDKGIARNVMYSGAAVYTPYYEAKVMALYAGQMGIPAENIYTELLAEHSTENIYYGYKKAQKLGFKKVALASDPFQTKMLRRYIRKKVSPDIALIPMVIDTMKMIEPVMTDPVIEYNKAYKEDFISIRERQSFWKRLRGTIRGNIDTAAAGAE
ncbi:MAG: YdcF family protein [Chitinophagaceae bacterium]|nr:YdcF family protein [Chitinophagaceae bacterium]